VRRTVEPIVAEGTVGGNCTVWIVGVVLGRVARGTDWKTNSSVPVIDTGVVGSRIASDEGCLVPVMSTVRAGIVGERDHIHGLVVIAYVTYNEALLVLFALCIMDCAVG